MFDVGWQELFIIVVLGIIVIGPKDLPRAVRGVTRWIRKARGMARDFQDGLDELVREAELDEIKGSIKDLSHGDVGKAVEQAIDPTGEMSQALDMTEVEDDLKKTTQEAIEKTAPADSSPSPGDTEDAGGPAEAAPGSSGTAKPKAKASSR